MNEPTTDRIIVHDSDIHNGMSTMIRETRRIKELLVA